MTMAILGLLAWKAFKHLSGNQSGSAPQPSPAPTPTHLPPAVNAGAGGGLGDLLKCGLGGLLAGGAAGSVLSGGLGNLLNQLKQSGHGETASTWVGKGQNKEIAPNDLANALGCPPVLDPVEDGSTSSKLQPGTSQPS